MVAIDQEGCKELLGLWIDQAERTTFLLRILKDLKNRGLSYILIAAVEGLSGFVAASLRYS